MVNESVRIKQIVAHENFKTLIPQVPALHFVLLHVRLRVMA